MNIVVKYRIHEKHRYFLSKCPYPFVKFKNVNDYPWNGWNVLVIVNKFNIKWLNKIKFCVLGKSKNGDWRLVERADIDTQCEHSFRWFKVKSPQPKSLSLNGTVHVYNLLQPHTKYKSSIKICHFVWCVEFLWLFVAPLLSQMETWLGEVFSSNTSSLLISNLL